MKLGKLSQVVTNTYRVFCFAFISQKLCRFENILRNCVTASLKLFETLFGTRIIKKNSIPHPPSGKAGTIKNLSSSYWLSLTLFIETPWKILLNTKQYAPGPNLTLEISEKLSKSFWNFTQFNCF